MRRLILTVTSLLFGALLALALSTAPAYAHPSYGQGCRCHGGAKKPAITKKTSKPAAPAVAPAPAPAPAPVPAPVVAPVVAPPVTPDLPLGMSDPVMGGIHFVGTQPGYGGRSDR